MSIKGKWARLIIGGVDLSAKTSSAEITIGVGTEEVTAWQDTARSYISTDSEPAFNIDGYVDSLSADTGGMEEALAEAFGADTAVPVAIVLHEAANTYAGMPAYVLPGTQGDNMSIAAPAAGVLTINGSFPGGASGWRRGYVLFRGTVSATGNQTGVDFGAAGTGGGDVFVFVTAITGTATNASIKVQRATGGLGTYADEATVTFSAVGGYSAAMTGSISQFLRMNTASMGGATSFVVTVIACVDGVTQPNY